MKGEYAQEDNDNHNSSMFAHLQQQPQKFQNRPRPLSASAAAAALHHNLHPTFQTSEEVDSQQQHHHHHHHHLSPQLRDPPTPTVHLLTPPPTAPSSANDGASIEVVRRPRGRPPGSKNKPKPPVIITREVEPSMRPYVLELPAGIDIEETILSFCRKRNTDLCILNGSGTVTNVTLRQPSTNPGASVTFHGRFDVLSLSATILAGNLGVVSVDGGVSNGFTISLAGPQGQVVGGAVVGPLYSAGTVYLIAASFNTPMFHRLPLEDERNSGSSRSGGGVGGGIEYDQQGRHQQQSPVSGGGGDSAGATAAPGAGGMEAAGGGVGLYNLPSDVIWAPAARQPPQHPPPY